MKVIVISPDKLYHTVGSVTQSADTSLTESGVPPPSSEGSGEWLGAQSTTIYGSRISGLGSPDKWAEIVVNGNKILLPLYRISDEDSHNHDNIEIWELGGDNDSDS